MILLVALNSIMGVTAPNLPKYSNTGYETVVKNRQTGILETIASDTIQPFTPNLNFSINRHFTDFIQTAPINFSLAEW
jgi:hypothetical protein